MNSSVDTKFGRFVSKTRLPFPPGADVDVCIFVQSGHFSADASEWLLEIAGTM